MSSSERQGPRGFGQSCPPEPGYRHSWFQSFMGPTQVGSRRQGSVLPSGGPGQEGETNPRTWLLALAGDLRGHVRIILWAAM